MGTEVIPNTEEAVSAEAPTDFEQKIIRQIEYYFGNYNLSRDKFLRNQIGEDDGWVPLEVLVKFNRLKKLSEDFAVITGALKKSHKQLMEISEDCKKIRRRNATPVPEDYSKRKDELDIRTLYVKGFKKNITFDELLDFFKEYNVENVFMRRHFHQNNKPFKGSCFVTFETKEDAESFLEKKGIKYGGTELLKEWKLDYTKRKDEFYSNLKAEKQKKMLKKAGMLTEETENGEKAPEIEVIPGCLLKLTNLDGTPTREQIKEVFEPHGTIVFVDYSKGKTSAVLRFEAGIASSVLEKMTEEDGERKADIGSCKVVVTLIEGDEEKDYWKNIAVLRAQSRLKFKSNRGSGNKAGNKGRFKNWGKRKGKGADDDKDDESAESPKKKRKVEAAEEKKETADPSKRKMEAETEKDETADPPKKKMKVVASEEKSESADPPVKETRAKASEAMETNSKAPKATEEAPKADS